MSQASSRTKCKHGNVVCEQCVRQIPSDAAMRFADGVNAILISHDVFDIRHHWLAVKLADGSVNSDIYDTREDAVRHQSIPAYHFFFPIGQFIGGLSYKDAELCLMIQRDANTAGIRITNGEDPVPDLITSFERGDIYRDLLRKGLRTPGRR